MAQLSDTRKVTGRRTLRFASIDELLADVDRLVEADHARQLTTLGNWTFGQTLGHLATWAEFAYTGTPMSPPWIVRFLSKLMKKKFIYGQLQAGFKLPRVPDGTLGTEPMDTDPAAERYRQIMQRLAREAPVKPNAVFGPLTHDEWINLHLRHAELHLSFMKPR